MHQGHLSHDIYSRLDANSDAKPHYLSAGMDVCHSESSIIRCLKNHPKTKWVQTTAIFILSQFQQFGQGSAGFFLCWYFSGSLNVAAV